MRSVQYATHVFRLMCHGSRFQFSCSCSQCTCPKLSLHLSNYSGYECAQVFLSYFSLVTGALALTIRVISVGWLESHLPSAPSDFFTANFRVTHLTVSCGAVPVSFNWVSTLQQLATLQQLVLAIFSATAIIRELWVAMHSASYQVTLPRACALTCGFADVLLMPDYSVDFVLITCFGTQGHETCLNVDLLSNSKSLNVQIRLLEMRAGAISSWRHCFVHISYSTTSCVVSSDVSCMSSYRTHFLFERLRYSCIWSLRVCAGHYFINC